ncbi:MAG: transposase [Labilibaculum antarcticum]
MEKSGFESFISIRRIFEVGHHSIIKYFIFRSTNASVEFFNAKIKDFRRTLRGIVDANTSCLD